jgi:hypothetical protein
MSEGDVVHIRQYAYLKLVALSNIEEKQSCARLNFGVQFGRRDFNNVAHEPNSG